MVDYELSKNIDRYLILEMTKATPNDAMLGAKLREYVNHIVTEKK